jgi:mono/diheme cytochrome c family protein
MARSPARTLAALTAFLAFSGVSEAQAGADAARGKLLYETRCSACHESSVHVRKARKATSFSALRAQVLRWSAEVGGTWSADEIDDVALYLNQRFYRLPCPQSVCKAAQASLTR